MQAWELSFADPRCLLGMQQERQLGSLYQAKPRNHMPKPLSDALCSTVMGTGQFNKLCASVPITWRVNHRHTQVHSGLFTHGTKPACLGWESIQECTFSFVEGQGHKIQSLEQGTLQMWLMVVTQLLLYFWDKTPPPQRPIKVVFNWALGSRRFWFMMADGGTATEAAESSHLELPAEGTGHTVKGMGSCETSKPVPSIISPPARPHLLILPKQPPAGAQVFKCPAVMQDPLFKPPRLTRTE